MAFSADQLLEKVNTYLATMPYVREPKGLYAPIEYVLSLGGKRIRPVCFPISFTKRMWMIFYHKRQV